MIKIEAIVRPQCADAVVAALKEAGVRGMTLTEVQGMGAEAGSTQHYRGAEYTILLHHKVKFEVVAADDDTEKIIQAIIGAARTGEVGDGKILVLPIADAIRIRSGERGRAAL